MSGTPFDRIAVRLRQVRYRLQLANTVVLLDIAGRLGRWALLRKLDLMGYPQRDRVGALLDREIAAIAPSVEAYLTHQRTEIEILSARLSRRYDPGAALNEATERAIRAKDTAMKAHAPHGAVFPELLGRVNERMLEGRDLRVLAEELKAKYGPLHGALPAEEEDFWTKEARRQREARAANPETPQPLTKRQEAALDIQKRTALETIAGAGKPVVHRAAVMSKGVFATGEIRDMSASTPIVGERRPDK